MKYIHGVKDACIIASVGANVCPPVVVAISDSNNRRAHFNSRVDAADRLSDCEMLCYNCEQLWPGEFCRDIQSLYGPHLAVFFRKISKKDVIFFFFFFQSMHLNTKLSKKYTDWQIT